MLRTVACLASILGLLTSLGCAYGPKASLARIEHKAMFHPVKLDSKAVVPFGLESVWFQAEEGPRLHGVIAHPNGRAPSALILFCHGNGGNADMRGERILREARLFNVAIFCFDYRGYGRSEGEPSLEGILLDARTARDWFAARFGRPSSDVVLMGESLGGGVAIELAAADGCRGLIIENSFTSLSAVGSYHAKFPVGGLMSADLDSVANIRRYQGPLLMRHGDADRIIPYAQGEALFAAANEPKRFISVPGGGHSDLPTPEFETAMQEFIRWLDVNRPVR